ncbi:hypothetical protein [Luedemannella helvata]|uniref:Glycerophosphoryl diester phosphodiesterase membrane domain-containing protein n=1 Tax=Luedemannella helvata TaxID=349315 RepID=A0ABP4W7H2_9ACTN
MRASVPPAGLQARPLTTGELLDAAVALLRTRARALLLGGLLISLAEQVILFGMRQYADVVDGIWPHQDRYGAFWLLLVVGAGTEALAVALLGITASAALPATIGATGRWPVRRGAALATAAIVAVISVCAAAIVLPGPVVFLLLGLAIPAAVIEGRGPGGALLRSVRLSVRYGLRAGWIRLVGYLSWLLIRLAVGLGTVAVVGIFIDTSTAFTDHLVTGLGWLFINAIAYPVLACLDAVLLVDTRFRSEGLDITLRRAQARRAPVNSLLAANS